MINLVINTKGGSGKSTTSIQILPLLSYIRTQNSIKIYEIDDNNTTKIDNSIIELKNFNLNQSDDAFDDIEFNNMIDVDTTYIVDAGGGNDTKRVLEKLHETDLEDITFYIPTNADYDQVDNIKNTILNIKKYYAEPKIILILNRCKELDEEKIKEQFFAIFGRDDYMINGRLEEIADDITGYFYIPDDDLFGILKDVYNKSLLDAYIDSKEMVDNRVEIKREWASESKESYKKNMSIMRFSIKIVELAENIIKINKV